ncbi:hypothetical protein MVEG_05392 [Podila verticillata NRRL 6337]|nr:hypothetical protein MVEG_05392 [Podila verticillata NRRL 6337]
MTEDGASPQPSTTVAAAAAAPETSTLAVKLSDGPDADKDHHDQKRFRSYEEGMNPEYGDPNNDHRDSHYPNRRLRSQDETQNDARPKYSETRSGRFSDSSDREQDHTRYSAREQEKQYLRQGNGGDMREGSQDQERNSQGTDEDRDNMDDDGYGDDGDDNEESESMDTNSSKNDDGSDPLIVSMYGSPSLVKVRSMFIDKLFKMVEDPAIQHLIAWAKEGDMFYVFNCIELSTSVLPKFFKHNNWQSFVRQLNMYGFHKIYRYDREESNMNRRNPETQRWQFYHPDFQRDQPHLRSNIKRKSARSINMVPTYSRVVFEPDKGYFMQQDGGPGPYVPGGPGGRFRVHSTGTAHSPNRGLLGMPPTVPSPQGFVPRPSYPIHKPSGPKDYRDDDHMSGRHPGSFPHQRRSHEQPPHHHSYSQSPHNRPGHQRQHSYSSTPHHPSPHHHAQGVHYGPKSVGPSPGPPHAHDHRHPGPPSIQGHARPGYAPHDGAGPVGPPHGYEMKHGLLGGAGGHFRSQSAPGLDPRREVARTQGSFGNSPPFEQQDVSPSQSNAVPYFREHPSQSPFRAGAPIDESHPGREAPGSMDAQGGSNDDASHRGSLHKHPLSPVSQPPAPEPPRHPSYPDVHGFVPSPHSHPGHVRHASMAGPDSQRRSSPPGVSQPPGPSQASGSSTLQPALPVKPPTESSEGLPRTVKQLESRLHFVEEAYMAMRQFAQELQNIQQSQDHTISWMRDRIEQLNDGPRGNYTRDLTL